MPSKVPEGNVFEAMGAVDDEVPERVLLEVGVPVGVAVRVVVVEFVADIFQSRLEDECSLLWIP